MKQMRSHLVVGLGMALGFCVVAPAFAEGAVPAAQMQGDVRYVTGGVGVDEAKAMRAEAAKYPLTLEFLVKTGKVDEFAGLVSVDISKSGGGSIFSANSDGPMMLVDLPPGKYHVKVTRKGREKSRDVELTKGGHVGATFEWTAEEAADK